MIPTRKLSQSASPRMGEDKKDLESLLPRSQETPPKGDPLHAQEHSRLILGLPVQLVAGAAYCAGENSHLVDLVSEAIMQEAQQPRKPAQGSILLWRTPC